MGTAQPLRCSLLLRVVLALLGPTNALDLEPAARAIRPLVLLGALPGMSARASAVSCTSGAPEVLASLP